MKFFFFFPGPSGRQAGGRRIPPLLSVVFVFAGVEIDQRPAVIQLFRTFPQRGEWACRCAQVGELHTARCFVFHFWCVIYLKKKIPQRRFLFDPGFQTLSVCWKHNCEKDSISTEWCCASNKTKTCFLLLHHSKKQWAWMFWIPISTTATALAVTELSSLLQRLLYFSPLDPSVWEGFFCCFFYVISSITFCRFGFWKPRFLLRALDTQLYFSALSTLLLFFLIWYNAKSDLSPPQCIYTAACHVTFGYVMWPVNAKKAFPVQFFPDPPQNTISCSCFFKTDVF